jgi:hypothetical protein
MAPSIVTLHIIAVIVAPTGQLAALSGNFFKLRPPVPAEWSHPAAESPADRELCAKVAVERTSNLSMGPARSNRYYSSNLAGD